MKASEIRLGGFSHLRGTRFAALARGCAGLLLPYGHPLTGPLRTICTRSARSTAQRCITSSRNFSRLRGCIAAFA